MRSFSTTSTIAHLPTELLSKILKNVHENTGYGDRNPGLHNLSLTCRHIHNLARPLIFSCFLIDYDDEGDDEGDDLPSRNIARFDFYSSDAIAPFVHEFEFNVFRNFAGAGMPQPEFPFVAKVFDALPRFINIQSLSCSGIVFTHFRLRQLSALSRLEHFDMADCSAPPKTDSLPIIRLRSFIYFTDSFPDDVRQIGVHRWLPLLDTNYLQDLRVLLTQDSCSFLIEDQNPSSSFSSLHSLDVNIDPEAFPMIPMIPIILSKAPALRSLKLCLDYLDTTQNIPTVETPTTCPVPYLDDYHGPHVLLNIILGQAMGSQSAHLRRVFLESIDEAGDPLYSFMNSFQSCHPLRLKALTHIHISLLKSIDFKSLAKLQDTFPALQVFHLHASENDSRRGGPAVAHNVDLTDLYTLPLPSTLVSLSIQWTSDGDAGVVPDLVAAKDNLVPRLPDLRRLFLCDLSQLALLWTRTASRTEEQCSLHDIGPSNDDVWKVVELTCPGDPFFLL